MLNLQIQETLDIPLILSDCIVRNYLAVKSPGLLTRDVCILFFMVFYDLWLSFTFINNSIHEGRISFSQQVEETFIGLVYMFVSCNLLGDHP